MPVSPTSPGLRIKLGCRLSPIGGRHWELSFINVLVVLLEWFDINDELDPGDRLSVYGPYAKGFGGTLDFNTTIILVPVARTFIRWYEFDFTEHVCVIKNSTTGFLTPEWLRKRIDKLKYGVSGRILMVVFNGDFLRLAGECRFLGEKYGERRLFDMIVCLC